VDDRNAWVPEDGPGQRPPLEGPTVEVVRRPVWVDPELERLAEPDRFAPEPERLDDRLDVAYYRGDVIEGRETVAGELEDVGP
jgi:hypothetical protein